MGGKNKEPESMKKIIDASVDVIKSVPIDEDAKTQIGKEMGKTFITVTKAVNIALTPLSMIVYGYDNIQEFIENKLASKLKEVPPENIVTPKASVVAGAIESLKYLDDSEGDLALKDMYASLIANAINIKTNSKIHPAFAEIIKQLDPLDVKLLEYLKEHSNSYTIYYTFLKVRQRLGQDLGELTICKWLLMDDAMRIFDHDTQKLGSSIENLIRLQLIRSEESRWQVETLGYESIRNGVLYNSYRNLYGENNISDTRGFLEITNFGDNFISVTS
ncbi:DUF4393 domain-containing protein [Providencia rettgeri]|nr:DUF4393 domain-containing protein [Providencia rettgeri]ELR5283508.1 DUF4393 domain-containing protein [Providencia rettgeri]